MRPAELVAVVLAGGRSSRMGREKAFMPVGGSGGPSLLEGRVRLLERLGVGRVLVSLRPDLDDATASCAEVVHDERPGLGPLAGIVAAMRAEPDRPLLVLAVDMPHVGRPLLSGLVGGAAPAVGVAPRVGGRWEPLCAVYPPAAEALARELLASGPRSPSVLLDRLARRGLMRSLAVGAADAWRLGSWNRPEDVSWWTGGARTARGPRSRDPAPPDIVATASGG